MSLEPRKDARRHGGTLDSFISSVFVDATSSANRVLASSSSRFLSKKPNKKNMGRWCCIGVCRFGGTPLFWGVFKGNQEKARASFWRSPTKTQHTNSNLVYSETVRPGKQPVFYTDKAWSFINHIPLVCVEPGGLGSL